MAKSATETDNSSMKNPAKNKHPQKKKHIPAYAGMPLSSNVKRQAIFWIGALIFFCIFLYVFSSILLPFVAGITLAYFLNPVVEFIERFHISRTWATVIILLVVILLFISALMVIVPLVAYQLEQFIKNGLPIYVERIQTFFSEHSFDWVEDLFGKAALPQADAKANLSALLNQSSGLIRSVLQSILDSGKSLFGIISLCVIAPVVTFYMLLDWGRMVGMIDSWIPRDHLKTVRGIFREMDRAVAGFIRGQGTVCLILGIYYATGLTICGLNFGLLIGLFVGLISFIPYVGSFSGFILAVGVAWVQYYPDNWQWIIVVMCIFFVGQFIEGYVLQPKLVGSSVGLHPVWLMFALLAFGSLFGFTGMLVAVPASAAIGVLVRFILHTYLSSPLYAKDPGKREPMETAFMEPADD